MEHKYKIPSSKNNLRLIRNFIQESIDEYEISEKKIHEIILSVDEVCANIISHSTKNYENSDLFSIDIKIKYDDSRKLQIEIKNPFNDDFNPKKHVSTPVKELVKQQKKGGLGLKLVKEYMDEFKLIKENNSTIYLLIKNC